MKGEGYTSSVVSAGDAVCLLRSAGQDTEVFECSVLRLGEGQEVDVIRVDLANPHPIGVRGKEGWSRTCFVIKDMRSKSSTEQTDVFLQWVVSDRRF